MQYKLAYDCIYVDESITGGPHYQICMINRSIPKWEDHAQVIVTAPDMLAALERLVQVNVDPNSTSTDWYMAWNRAEKTIIKAKTGV